MCPSSPALPRAALAACALALGCADSPATAPAPVVDAALPIVVADTAGAAAQAALRSGAAFRSPPAVAQPSRAAATLEVSAPVAVEQTATLLTPIGGRFTALRSAAAINAAGHVVGSGERPDGRFTAFLWQEGAETIDLGTLGAPLSVATDINAAGQVVGWSITAGGDRRAFLWERGAGMRDLGTPPGNTESVALAINDAGQVVGWGHTDDEDRHDFLWEAGTGMTSLGLPVRGSPYGINNAGQIVGGSAGGPFLREPDGSVRFLDTLSTPLARQFGVAEVVNDAGQVVGARSFDPADPFQRQAFVWDRHAGTTDLGALLGARESGASAINNAGQVVGYSAGWTDPFFWQRGVGMVELTSPGGEGAASDINDAGQVVGSSLVKIGGESARRATLWTVRVVAAGAPTVDRLRAASLPAGVYPQYAPNGGVWLRVRLADADTPAPGPWRWTIDWGDGVVHAPTVAIKGEFAFVRAAPYASVGPRTITVTAVDPAGLASAARTTRAP